MPSKPIPPDVPMGDLAFHVLLALATGRSHGYAIGKDIEVRTNGRLDPTTGALYQALKRLSDEGLIAPARRPAAAGDARRKYFQLTAAGRRAAAAEADRLAELIAVARARNLYPYPVRGR